MRWLNNLGVSFCEISDSDLDSEQIKVINDWPSQHTKIGTKEKVPSEISYNAQGLTWGSLIPPNVPRHMWTKLQLDSHEGGQMAKIKHEVSAASGHTPKEAIEVVADFLAQVKTHLIKNLDQSYGPVLWRTLPITLVVTVPAVWSDLAKARTLEAVDRAGFNARDMSQLCNTVVVTEPESAAIYTIKTLRGM